MKLIKKWIRIIRRQIREAMEYYMALEETDKKDKTRRKN